MIFTLFTKNIDYNDEFTKYGVIRYTLVDLHNSCAMEVMLLDE